MEQQIWGVRVSRFIRVIRKGGPGIVFLGFVVVCCSGLVDLGWQSRQEGGLYISAVLVSQLLSGEFNRASWRMDTPPLKLRLRPQTYCTWTVPSSCAVSLIFGPLVGIGFIEKNCKTFLFSYVFFTAPRLLVHWTKNSTFWHKYQFWRLEDWPLRSARWSMYAPPLFVCLGWIIFIYIWLHVGIGVHYIYIHRHLFLHVNNVTHTHTCKYMIYNM